MEGTAVDPSSGEAMWKTTSSIFIRGEGGWGGDRGPSGPRNVAPEREPGHTVTYGPREEQSLLYRLSGVVSPMHSDPSFASLGGFRSVERRVRKECVIPWRDRWARV